MPSPDPRAVLPRWKVPRRVLEDSRARIRARPRVRRLSRFDLFCSLGFHAELNQTCWRMHGLDRLIEHLECRAIGIFHELPFHGREKAAPGAELVMDRRRFVTAVHHAIRAFWIA